MVEIFKSLKQFPADARGGALCIGNFDGVHIGHQRLLAETVRLAKSIARPAVVLTFDPHPMRLLNPQKMPEPICRMEEKTLWLGQTGANMVVVERTSLEILQLGPEQFVDNILVKYIGPKWIVEGQSFRFGLGRKGDVNSLQVLGQSRGFQVAIVPPVQADLGKDREFTVSSSLVRELLRGGLVAQARQCLGRPHLLTGVVGRGMARGRKLGFPTANLGNIGQLTPAEGVYAGRGWIKGRCFPAAISVGTAITFDHGERLIEAILLGLNEDIYGQEIRLEFFMHIRLQQRFPGAMELAQQIKADCQKVEELIASGQIEIPSSSPTERT